MNKPEKPDVTEYHMGNPFEEESYYILLEKYYEDLEKYCNELEKKTYTLKEAYELACDQLNDYQTKLFDLEKKITHIVRVYGCRDGVYSISSEKWQKTLLDAVKKQHECFEKEYEAHYLDKNCEEKENG